MRFKAIVSEALGLRKADIRIKVIRQWHERAYSFFREQEIVHLQSVHARQIELIELLGIADEYGIDIDGARQSLPAEAFHRTGEFDPTESEAEAELAELQAASAKLNSRLESYSKQQKLRRRSAERPSPRKKPLGM